MADYPPSTNHPGKAKQLLKTDNIIETWVYPLTYAYVIKVMLIVLALYEGIRFYQKIFILRFRVPKLVSIMEVEMLALIYRLF